MTNLGLSLGLSRSGGESVVDPSLFNDGTASADGAFSLDDGTASAGGVFTMNDGTATTDGVFTP